MFNTLVSYKKISALFDCTLNKARWTSRNSGYVLKVIINTFRKDSEEEETEEDELD